MEYDYRRASQYAELLEFIRGDGFGVLNQYTVPPPREILYPFTLHLDPEDNMHYSGAKFCETMHSQQQVYP